jgi:chemosensory pili system protein ChpA (sensor histidine kinase/response regulator)
MPRMDGFEFVRNVRADETHKNVPIIMISSRTAEKHQSHAKELGVNAFLGKPVGDDELISAMDKLLKSI